MHLAIQIGLYWLLGSLPLAVLVGQRLHDTWGED